MQQTCVGSHWALTSSFRNAWPPPALRESVFRGKNQATKYQQKHQNSHTHASIATGPLTGVVVSGNTIQRRSWGRNNGSFHYAKQKFRSPIIVVPRVENTADSRALARVRVVNALQRDFECEYRAKLEFCTNCRTVADRGLRAVFLFMRIDSTEI